MLRIFKHGVQIIFITPKIHTYIMRVIVWLITCVLAALELCSDKFLIGLKCKPMKGEQEC